MATVPASRPPPSMNEDGVMINQEQYAKLPRFYQAAALKPRADVVAARALPRASDRLAAATALRDRGRKLLGLGQWDAAATELEGALGVIKYLEPATTPSLPAATIHDTEQQQHASSGSVDNKALPLLREINLMAPTTAAGGTVAVARAARAVAVHCLLGLGAAYFHVGDAQSCVAACDEALASECLSPSPPIPPTSSSAGVGLMGPPPPPPPRAHRAQALFWRARARSLSVEEPAAAAKGGAGRSVRSAPSVEPAAAKGVGSVTAEQQGQGGQHQHRRYVMQLALKDLAEAVRLEPGNRAIRGEYFRLKRRLAEEEARGKRRSLQLQQQQTLSQNHSSSSTLLRPKHALSSSLSSLRSSNSSSARPLSSSSLCGSSSSSASVRAAMPSSAVSSLASLASVTHTAMAATIKEQQEQQEIQPPLKTAALGSSGQGGTKTRSQEEEEEEEEEEEGGRDLLDASVSLSVSAASDDGKREKKAVGVAASVPAAAPTNKKGVMGMGAAVAGLDSSVSSSKPVSNSNKRGVVGPAVLGGQMRRLAWVAREREQAGDALEARQLREAAQECQGWLAAEAAKKPTRNRLLVSKKNGSGAAAVTAAAGAGAVLLRKRSSSADDSGASSSHSIKKATTAAVAAAAPVAIRPPPPPAAAAAGSQPSSSSQQERQQANPSSPPSSPVRAVLRRCSLLLLLTAFSFALGALMGSSPRHDATVQQDAETQVFGGVKEKQREERERTREEWLLLAARTVVPMPIRVVGEDGEEIEEEAGGLGEGRWPLIVP